MIWKSVDRCNDENDPKDCSNKGICVNTDKTDTGYICYCESGWVGEDCETSKAYQRLYFWKILLTFRVIFKLTNGIFIEDVCYPNPCMHDGFCIADDDGWSCECKDGYFGETCDIGKLQWNVSNKRALFI